MTRRVLLAALLACPLFLSAAFDGPQRELGGAAAAGRGGVESAAGPALEAVAQNPARLPAEGDLHAGLLGGLDPAASGRWALGMAGVALPGLRWGLLYGGDRDARLAALDAQELSAALALGGRDGQSLGLRVNGRWLDASGQGRAAQGATLDLGWLRQRVPLPGLPGSATFGLAAENVAGAWSDEAWSRAVPSRLRAGASWRPWPDGWIGAEALWSSDTRAPGGGSPDWRAGLQWSPLGPAWTLRAGWRGPQAPEPTAGLGLRLPGGAALDYALLLPGAGASHRLSLTWSYTRPEDQWINVRPSLVLTDPDSGAVERASFVVSVDPRLGAQDWSLELRDADDRLRRSLGPQNASDAVVDWDGRDAEGRPLEGGRKVYYALVARTPQGLRRRVFSLALDQALMAGAAGGGEIDPPELKPAFSADGVGLDQVLMILPRIGGVESWRLDLQDPHGRTWRRYAGLGDPPRELVWDGRDADGRKVADPLSVAVEFQVRLVGGKVLSSARPLFTQQAFEIAQRAVRERPSFSLAPPGLPLLSGEVPLRPAEGFLSRLLDNAERQRGDLARRLREADWEALKKEHSRASGAGLELDLFSGGTAQLVPERRRLVELLPIQDGGTLVVEGLARADQPGLARARALAAAGAFKDQVLQGRSLVLREAVAASDEGAVRVYAAAPATGSALADAAPDAVSARYAVDPPPASLSSSPGRPLPAAQAQALLARWGLDKGAPAQTQWCPATRKAAVLKDGWIWISDADGTVLRSLWYEPDLNADGRLRWSEDGRVLWFRADGWRRWFSLEMALALRN